MDARLRELRAFFSPIPDDALPDLKRTFASAVRIITPLLFIGSVAFVATELWLGDPPTATLAPLTIGTFGYPLAYVAQRRRWLSSEVVLFLTGMWLASFMSYEGAAGIEGLDGLLAFAGVVPLLFASFIPWDPRYSLLLVLPAMGGAGIATWLDRPLPIPPAVMIFVWVAAGLSAALGNQFTRRRALALEQTKGRLVAAERMSSLGRLTASMAHELKTPIGASMNDVEMLRRLTSELMESIGHPQVTEDDLREISQEMRASLTTLSSALDRAGRYIAAMREHTVSGRDRPITTYAVLSRVESVATLLAPALRQAEVTLSTEGVDPELRMTGDPGKLDQILLNLIQNAIEAMMPGKRGGHIELSARAQGKHGVVIRVRDDGPGIPDSIGDRVFEPLFTTRLDGGGTGLGLAICRDLAQADLSGSLRLVPSDRGACFELTCPRQAESGAPRDDPWQPPQRHDRRAVELER